MHGLLGDECWLGEVVPPAATPCSTLKGRRDHEGPKTWTRYGCIVRIRRGVGDRGGGLRLERMDAGTPLAEPTGTVVRVDGGRWARPCRPVRREQSRGYVALERNRVEPALVDHRTGRSERSGGCERARRQGCSVRRSFRCVDIQRHLGLGRGNVDTGLTARTSTRAYQWRNGHRQERQRRPLRRSPPLPRRRGQRHLALGRIELEASITGDEPIPALQLRHGHRQERERRVVRWPSRNRRDRPIRRNLALGRLQLDSRVSCPQSVGPVIAGDGD